MPEALEMDTWVYYHGSITDRHGYMRVVNTHAAYNKISDDDTTRYVLKYSPKFRGYLENVRPNSFSMIDSYGSIAEDQPHKYPEDHPTATE